MGQRKDFEVRTCFVPLLGWVLSFWPEKRLALAWDVTNLRGRFHVLCVRVLYGGIGIPVAWKVLAGGQPEAWHPHWCALLQRLKPAADAEWQVVVLSDRGLESPRLFAAIVGLHWHPLMRVKIEQGFEVTKSAGLNRQHARMTHSARAERHFLAIAVTILWLAAVGAEVERQVELETTGRLRSTDKAQAPNASARIRRVRLFMQGAAKMIAALVNRACLPRGKFFPESWPESTHASSINEEEFIRRLHLQL